MRIDKCIHDLIYLIKVYPVHIMHHLVKISPGISSSTYLICNQNISDFARNSMHIYFFNNAE